MSDGNIRTALEVESHFTSDKDLMRDYEQREKAYRDWESDMIASRDEGKAEGLALGQSNANLKTARLMLDDNMPLEMIHKFTGLSASEIQALQCSSD